MFDARLGVSRQVGTARQRVLSRAAQSVAVCKRGTTQRASGSGIDRNRNRNLLSQFVFFASLLRASFNQIKLFATGRDNFRFDACAEFAFVLILIWSSSSSATPQGVAASHIIRRVWCVCVCVWKSRVSAFMHN